MHAFTKLFFGLLVLLSCFHFILINLFYFYGFFCFIPSLYYRSNPTLPPLDKPSTPRYSSRGIYYSELPFPVHGKGNDLFRI